MLSAKFSGDNGEMQSCRTWHKVGRRSKSFKTRESEGLARRRRMTITCTTACWSGGGRPSAACDQRDDGGYPRAGAQKRLTEILA